MLDSCQIELFVFQIEVSKGESGLESPFQVVGSVGGQNRDVRFAWKELGQALLLLVLCYVESSTDVYNLATLLDDNSLTVSRIGNIEGLVGDHSYEGAAATGDHRGIASAAYKG